MNKKLSECSIKKKTRLKKPFNRNEEERVKQKAYKAKRFSEKYSDDDWEFTIQNVFSYDRSVLPLLNRKSKF